MMGTNGCRRDTLPFRIIPERGQSPEYGIQPPNKQSCNVLHEDVSGLKQANDAGVFKPQSRSLASKSCPLSGEGNILAGESPADEINIPLSDRREGSHIIPSGHVGPVLLKDSSCMGINLHLPLADHPGPLKPKVEAPDAGEQ
jgi:hypothetical protein